MFELDIVPSLIVERVFEVVFFAIAVATCAGLLAAAIDREGC